MLSHSVSPIKVPPWVACAWPLLIILPEVCNVECLINPPCPPCASCRVLRTVFYLALLAFPLVAGPGSGALDLILPLPLPWPAQSHGGGCPPSRFFLFFRITHHGRGCGGMTNTHGWLKPPKILSVDPSTHPGVTLTTGMSKNALGAGLTRQRSCKQASQQLLVHVQISCILCS